MPPGETGMPLYEYSCVSCGHRFQQHRKVTQRAASRCPRCNGRVKKLFGAVGIIFKGPGFHTTDYRKPEAKPAHDKKPADDKKADLAGAPASGKDNSEE